jgi:hypothetical protein
MTGYDLNARAALYRCTEEASAADILRGNSIAEGSLRKMLTLAISDPSTGARTYAIAIKGRPLLRSGRIAEYASAEGILPVTY